MLRLDPANARATRQLGLLHNQLGELAQAFRFLLKAQELTPDDSGSAKLGGIYFVAGKPDEAREEAASVLDQGAEEPRCPCAPS